MLWKYEDRGMRDDEEKKDETRADKKTERLSPFSFFP